MGAPLNFVLIVGDQQVHHGAVGPDALGLAVTFQKAVIHLIGDLLDRLVPELVPVGALGGKVRLHRLRKRVAGWPSRPPGPPYTRRSQDGYSP